MATEQKLARWGVMQARLDPKMDNSWNLVPVRPAGLNDGRLVDVKYHDGSSATVQAQNVRWSHATHWRLHELPPPPQPAAPTIETHDLDNARAHEAIRIAGSHSTRDVAREAARLARTGWTPTDPLVLQAREIVAAMWDSGGNATNASRYRQGLLDDARLMQVTLTALKAARNVAPN